MSRIEEMYRERVDAMTPSERLQRSIGIADWARRMIASQVLEEKGPMDESRLKWEVALRLYRDDPWVCDTIRRRLETL